MPAQLELMLPLDNKHARGFGRSERVRDQLASEWLESAIGQPEQVVVLDLRLVPEQARQNGEHRGGQFEAARLCRGVHEGRCAGGEALRVVELEEVEQVRAVGGVVVQALVEARQSRQELVEFGVAVALDGGGIGFWLGPK